MEGDDLRVRVLLEGMTFGKTAHDDPDLKPRPSSGAAVRFSIEAIGCTISAVVQTKTTERSYDAVAREAHLTLAAVSRRVADMIDEAVGRRE